MTSHRKITQWHPGPRLPELQAVAEANFAAGRILTLPQAALILNMANHRIVKLIDAGELVEIPAHLVGRRRVASAEVQRYLDHLNSFALHAS